MTSAASRVFGLDLVLQWSGWPVWVGAVLGVLLILWGALADAGIPLLVGVVLAGTSPQWLRLPALPELWLRQA